MSEVPLSGLRGERFHMGEEAIPGPQFINKTNHAPTHSLLQGNPTYKKMHPPRTYRRSMLRVLGGS
jgi:hypothetical protein